MEIVSTMGSGSLGREIDLNSFVAALNESLDSPEDANFTSSGMVTIRLKEDGPAYTVFRTGSFQIRGSKNEQRLNEAESKFREALSNIDFEIYDYEFDHVTSVFMFNLAQEVDLEVLTIALGMEETEYEPEQFSGLIYRPSELEVTLLVFSSGKVIIGGTPDREHASAAIAELRDNADCLQHP